MTKKCKRRRASPAQSANATPSPHPSEVEPGVEPERDTLLQRLPLARGYRRRARPFPDITNQEEEEERDAAQMVAHVRCARLNAAVDGRTTTTVSVTMEHSQEIRKVAVPACFTQRLKKGFAVLIHNGTLVPSEVMVDATRLKLHELMQRIKQYHEGDAPPYERLPVLSDTTPLSHVNWQLCPPAPEGENRKGWEAQCNKELLDALSQLDTKQNGSFRNCVYLRVRLYFWSPANDIPIAHAIGIEEHAASVRHQGRVTWLAAAGHTLNDVAYAALHRQNEGRRDTQDRFVLAQVIRDEDVADAQSTTGRLLAVWGDSERLDVTAMIDPERDGSVLIDTAVRRVLPRCNCFVLGPSLFAMIAAADACPDTIALNEPFSALGQGLRAVVLPVSDDLKEEIQRLQQQGAQSAVLAVTASSRHAQSQDIYVEALAVACDDPLGRAALQLTCLPRVRQIAIRPGPKPSSPLVAGSLSDAGWPEEDFFGVASLFCAGQPVVERALRQLDEASIEVAIAMPESGLSQAWLDRLERLGTSLPGAFGATGSSWEKAGMALQALPDECLQLAGFRCDEPRPALVLSFCIDLDGRHLVYNGPPRRAMVQLAKVLDTSLGRSESEILNQFPILTYMKQPPCLVLPVRESGTYGDGVMEKVCLSLTARGCRSSWSGGGVKFKFDGDQDGSFRLQLKCSTHLMRSSECKASLRLGGSTEVQKHIFSIPPFLPSLTYSPSLSCREIVFVVAPPLRADCCIQGNQKQWSA